jgi:hypothetical protein
MTSKERLHRLVDDLTDAEAARARVVVEGASPEPATPEEWGALHEQMDTAMRESLRELDEEERNAGLPPWLP